MRVGIQFLF